MKADHGVGRTARDVKGPVYPNTLQPPSNLIAVGVVKVPPRGGNAARTARGHGRIQPTTVHQVLGLQAPQGQVLRLQAGVRQVVHLVVSAAHIALPALRVQQRHVHGHAE